METDYIMETNFIIVTELLYLVRPSQEYLTDLHSLHSDPRTNIYNPAGPHQSIEETEEMLKSWIEHWFKYRFGYALMIEKASGQMVGMCGLTYKSMLGETYLNLAYRLNPEYARKGFTKEACLAIIDYVKEDIQVNHQILVRTKKDNFPSIMTAQSLGFEKISSYNNYEEMGDIYLFE